MNVLTVKQLIEMNDAISEGNPLDAFFDEDVTRKKMEMVKKVAKSLEESAEKSRELITNKISERMFSEIARVVQCNTLSAMISNGSGFELLESHANGDLRGYTHTIFLAILGILMDEEVL